MLAAPVFRILRMFRLAVMRACGHRCRGPLVGERGGRAMKTPVAAGPGVPLAAGVGARLPLLCNRLDVPLEGDPGDDRAGLRDVELSYTG